jgi:hypothetical protein
MSVGLEGHFVNDPGHDIERQRCGWPISGIGSSLPDVAGRLGDRTEQTEHRGSDKANSGLVSRPSELHVVNPVIGGTRVKDLKRQRLAGVFEMRQEVHLGLLGNPIRALHGCDQIGSAVSELRSVGDTFAQFVVIPTAIRH